MDKETGRQGDKESAPAGGAVCPCLLVSLSPCLLVSSRRRRPAFTLIELVAAMGGLAVALAIVGQIALWTLTDRRRTAVRYEALEAATNILEAAQAASWEALTPAWAAGQRLPDDLAKRLIEPRLTVKVEPEPSRAHAKRVSVTIAWQLDEGVPAAPVVLAGWFSARVASGTGGKP